MAVWIAYLRGALSFFPLSNPMLDEQLLRSVNALGRLWGGVLIDPKGMLKSAFCGAIGLVFYGSTLQKEANRPIHCAHLRVLKGWKGQCVFLALEASGVRDSWAFSWPDACQ